MTPPKKTTVYLTTFVFASPVIRCDACRGDINRVKRISGSPKGRYVLVNVRRKGKWIRMERYHLSCYLLEGKPHGEPVEREARTILPNPLRSKAVKDFLSKSG